MGHSKSKLRLPITSASLDYRRHISAFYFGNYLPPYRSGCFVPVLIVENTMTNLTDPEPHIEGKTFVWEPLISQPILLESIAADARPDAEQLSHFALMCVGMRATLDETSDIIEALQYCERAHGYAKIATSYVLIVGALDSAVTLIPSTITMIGIQRQLASPGLFIGALIEQVARVDAPTRKFPMSQYRERLRSPHVEFEDCLIGASVARRLGVLTDSAPHAARPFGRLVAEFRKKQAQRGILVVDEAARDVQTKSQDAMPARFMASIDALAKSHAVALPALWRKYVQEGECKL